MRLQRCTRQPEEIVGSFLTMKVVDITYFLASFCRLHVSCITLSKLRGEGIDWLIVFEYLIVSNFIVSSSYFLNLGNVCRQAVVVNYTQLEFFYLKRQILEIYFE